MKIDLDQIRELLAVVSQTDISELTIEAGDQKITVKKGMPKYAPTAVEWVAPAAPASIQPPAMPAAPAPAPGADQQTSFEPTAKAEDTSAKNGLVPISSPMVGTFYRSPSPTAAPFVEVGDRISNGQTVCIIEAMKLMNDLPAEIAGRIVKICAENGTTVEFGQPLFMVDPNG